MNQTERGARDRYLKALVAALRSVYTGTAIRVSNSDRDAVDLSTVLLDYQEGCSDFEPSTMIHLHHESQIPEPVRIDRQLSEGHGGTIIGDRRSFHQEGGICTREATRRISLAYWLQKHMPTGDLQGGLLRRYVYLPGDEGHPVGTVVAEKASFAAGRGGRLIVLDIEGASRDIARLETAYRGSITGGNAFMLGGQDWDKQIRKITTSTHEKPVYCPKGCGSEFWPESMDKAPLCRTCGREMVDRRVPLDRDKDRDKGFATLTIDVLAPYHTLERGEDVFRVAAFHFAHVYVGTITEATRQHTRYGRVHRLRIRGTEEDTAKALEIFTEVGSGKFVLVQGERFRVQGEMSWQRDA